MARRLSRSYGSAPTFDGAFRGTQRRVCTRPHRSRLLYPHPMTDPADLPRFVPLEHVQQELSISYLQALQLVRSGELRAIQVGGRKQWRVALAALEEYIAARYAETAAMVETEADEG